ncbi:MAG: hypothetical protein AB3N18_16870 [Allomuricauda sp.]
MLTLEHLKVYHKYNGNGEYWDRSNSKKDRMILSDENWNLIDNLKTEIKLINDNLASKDFEEKVKLKLKKYADAETQQYLWKNKKPRSVSFLKRIFGKTE